MKKLLSAISIVVLVSISGLCYAQDTIVRISNPLPWKTFLEFINKIIDVVLIVGVALAPVMILIGAFYMTTSGSPTVRQDEQIKKAKAIIQYTVIGLILLLGAKGFAYWIYQKFSIVP